MKDSTKLYLASVGLVIAGCLKGTAPTVLGEPFDDSSFWGLCVIAVIVFLLGLIKRLRGK